MTMPDDTFRNLTYLARADVESLQKAAQSYGTSWRNRGGIGAFMMLARKWDRLENQVKKHGWDVFDAIMKDQRAEGIIDDIRDLRRYLLLVEEHMTAEGHVKTPALAPKEDVRVRVEQENPFGYEE